MTNQTGAITAISKGLADELGVTSAFFQASDEFSSQMKISHLFPFEDLTEQFEIV